MDINKSLFNHNRWRKYIFIYVFFLVLVTSVTTNIYASGYIIGPGDVISVTVFNEEEMSLPNSKVPKGGKLSFPMIGEVKVGGLSARKLKQKLITKLKDGYLKKPQLIVNILQYRPFFVNGQVRTPGGYPYVDGLTVRKAIALAGGLTDRASLKKISLIVEGKKSSARKSGNLDMSMGPGDVLTIGESLF